MLCFGSAEVKADPHALGDEFAAELAKLLPPAELPVPLATPPAQRITLGDWSAVIPWTPHIPVSAANLPDGRVLTFASNERTTFPAGVEFTYAATWDPATGQFVEYNHPSHDMFCGALVMLPDGRVLVNGGRNTTVRASIFDWRTNAWTRIQDMNDPRWYNTSVALPDGRVWTVTGDGGTNTAERWQQSSGWSRQTGVAWSSVIGEPGYITRWHPFLLLAPDGRMIHFGPTDTMHWVNPSGSGSMVNSGNTVPGAHYPKEGAWVMYDEGRILVAGGGANTTANGAGDGTTGTSTNLAYTVDVRSGTPVVAATASMRFVRQFANSVVLPNGEVLVMGGNTGIKFNDSGSIFTAEIWNPATGTWRDAADASVPRNYHSLALLLPDGRVLSGGGGLSGNSADHRDAQIYTPPKLFNADGTLAARPVLSAAPTAIGAGTAFTVTGTTGLQKFSFIKMSAITHSVNTDVRYLSLPFTETSAGTYRVTAHTSLNVMTPGYWMLFGLNSAGVHSVAKVILVDSIAGVTVTSPGNQAALIGQPTSLQMIATAPVGSVLTWSATGLPPGLSIHPGTGLISGTPTTLGTFDASVGATNGTASGSTAFSWSIQPTDSTRDFPTFTGATGLTFNGNAALASSVLRLTTNVTSQTGSAFLSDPFVIGSDTSFDTRLVFRAHGTANGGHGLTFLLEGVGPNALGAGGNGLGYGGIATSLAVEIDNQQAGSDTNGNHIAVLSNGSVDTHLATFVPAWDLEDGASHTLWADYDGATDQLRVFAAQGVVQTRPASPVITLAVDLPALVGSRAWIGFTAATAGSRINNHDVEAWSLSLSANAQAQPVLTQPGARTQVVGTSTSVQLQATDPNGDLLTWSATGLPPGLSIQPSNGLVTGIPTTVGDYAPVVTVSDNHTAPVSAGFSFRIDPVLTLTSLSGATVPAGSTVPLVVYPAGGANPVFQWSFGDGTPDTPFSSSASTAHTFANPGRYLVTVTGRDDTGREITSSYHQAVHAPLTAAQPRASSSILYEDLPGIHDRIWVVNPDNDTVSVFGSISRAKLAEVGVGAQPRTLARAPDGRVWVTNAKSASITIIASDYSVTSTVPLPRGSRPYGIVFDPAGAAAYVALEGTGRILMLDPVSAAVLEWIDVGPDVRHLSITADGARILASRFVSPPLPGEGTASPQTTVGNRKYGGEVVVIARAGMTLERTIVLEHSEAPNTSTSAKGIPNYLGAAVVSPDGLAAWVPSKQDNITRGTLRSNSTLTHDMAMRSVASRIDLSTASEDVFARVDFDNGGIASAAAFDPKGNYLYVALEGSREVAVVDVWNEREILRFDAGRAPQALVVDPDGNWLWVHNFMDRSVTAHDITALQSGGLAAPPPPAVLNCIAFEVLSPQVLLGKRLFYDARDNRIALESYISCAGCHNDGGQDGRVWDFTQFGEGLRNTLSLRGHGGMAHGPLHWTGNFDEVQDFEGQIRNFDQGLGLMADADFHAGTRSQPLGLPKAGLSADLDALAAYVSSLTEAGQSPDRAANGALTPAGVAGRNVFIAQNCASCHAGARFTDSALNVFHEVGTRKPSSGGRLGGTLTGFDTPTLIGAFATAPYLHDGSAATLADAVSAHSGVTLSGQELAELVAYLRQLDDDANTPQPATISWATPASIPYGTPLGATQLDAVADVPGTFVYSPPAGTVLDAGTRTLTVTFTPDDFSARGVATASVSIGVSKAALSLRANDRTKVYGAAVPALTVSATGFVNGDTLASLDTQPNVDTPVTPASAVGTYGIRIYGARDSNYTITFTGGTLTVTPAPLIRKNGARLQTAPAAGPSGTSGI